MKKSGVELAQDLLAQAKDVEDPWLISYADLVTNLLAFMVLLVSLAGISFESMERLESVFENTKKPPPLQALSKEIATLAEQEGLRNQVAAEVDNEGLAIRLSDQILFPSGVATLTDDGNKLVSKVARLLENIEDRYRVRVEGHTDDVPIKTARFSSNWELSAARALDVRNRLASSGVADERLSIAAYADTRPIKSEPDVSLVDRRRKNRRVVIRVHY